MPPRQGRHDQSILHEGCRNEIDLEVVRDDANEHLIDVSCTCCQRVFSIPRSSLSKERQRARDLHCTPTSAEGESTLLAPSSANVPSGASASVVPSGGDGRRYLEHLGVDDVILSVDRRLCDGNAILYAKMVDKQEEVMGMEMPQAKMGYPSVVMRSGSQVDMDCALRLVHRKYMQRKAYQQKCMERELKEDAEWKSRVAAFNLLCDPKRCPDPSLFTTENMDKCLDMLLDEIPWDFENGDKDESGSTISCTPRLGTHLPQSYRWTREQNQLCIMDFETPGPAQYMPVLIDVLTVDCRTHRKLCLFQLRSGEHVKVWVRLALEGGSEEVYPQLDTLLARDIKTIQLAKRVVETERRDGRLHTRVSFLMPPMPPPERVTLHTSLPRLTNETVIAMLEQHGRVGDFSTPTLMAPTHDDEEERRSELKASILEGKAEECLDLLSIVSPGDALMTPGMPELRHYTVDALEKQTLRLLSRVRALGCRPRALPEFDSTADELDLYMKCNSLHKQIARLHAAGGCSDAPDLDRMGAEGLAGYWAKAT